MKLEERKSNRIIVRECVPGMSRIGMDGRLYISLGGDYIHTSRVVYIFQDADNRLVCQTRSGSEYAFTFDSMTDYRSLLSSTLKAVAEENVVTVIKRPHMRDLFKCFY